MAIHCLKLGDALCFPRRLSVHGVRMDRSQPPLQHHGVRIVIAGWEGFEMRERGTASLENQLLWCNQRLRSFCSAWRHKATARECVARDRPI